MALDTTDRIARAIESRDAEIERLRAALTEIADPLMLDIPGSVFGIERALKIINRMRDIAKKALGIALADACGGTIESIGGPLPDGSGFATVSFPLPEDHWLYAGGSNVPPMPFRMGTDDPRYYEFHDKMKAAARYAARCATMNGKFENFDPDALVQNFLVGVFGYHTPDGLSGEDWGNPNPVPPTFQVRDQERVGSHVSQCPSCKRMFIDGETCHRGGCPMGGDV